MEGQSSKWVELSKGQNHEVEAANIWYAPNRPYINRHLRSGLNASNYNLRRLSYFWLLLFQKLLVSTYLIVRKTPSLKYSVPNINMPFKNTRFNEVNF